MSPDVEPAPETPVAWHDAHGARWSEISGRRTVAGYGDTAAEGRALRRGCGLIERRWTERFVVAGEDRSRFLNGYLTCDVGALAAGAGAYGFFTTAQGRILSDAVVGATEDALEVDVPAGRAPALLEHLSRYVLADRVELSISEGVGSWLVAGPEAPAVLESVAGGSPGEVGSRLAAEISGRDVEVARERDLGVRVFSLHLAAAHASLVADAIIAAGAIAVGVDALEKLRVEAGVPRYGAEFDEAHFPQETGLEETVSYTKGCYLGQEVVARIHYRGHVNHQLRGLAIEPAIEGEVPVPGVPILFEDEVVGKLGSAVVSERLGAIGLAVIHRKAAQPGSRVVFARGGAARVEEAGFALAAQAEGTGDR